MDEIEIIKSGTEVETVNGQIKGTVTAASIRFNSVSYEISYFHNGEYKSCWMNELEFKSMGDNYKQKVGFKS